MKRQLLLSLLPLLPLILIPGAVVPAAADASAAAEPEVIENQTFDAGLKLEGRENVVIRNCKITNPDGTYGIWLKGCRNVRVEGCTIRRVGNEAMQENDVRIIQGYEYVPAALDHLYGVFLENCHGVTVAGCEITDSASKGITVAADRWDATSDIVLEKNRIAYVYDDGIDFHTRGPRGGDPKATLLMRGVVIRDNLIHDIGLGLTRLGFARHGMYLSVRDAVVEGNTIYNCFYGEGISIRNAAVVRKNRVRNCARACIAYWPQTSTEGTSGEVRIEDNDCRQDFALPIPMRHISDPGGKLHHLPLATVLLGLSDNPHAKIRKFVVRGNRLHVGADYAEDNPVVGGNGDPALNKAAFDISGNRLTDLRPKANYFANLPAGVDTGRNETVASDATAAAAP